jgi:hypothetical protein
MRLVLLLFYNENKELIGKDRVVLGDEKKVAALPIDGFELRGIVTDETKTKVGKDFMIYIIISIMNIKLILQ